MKSPNGINSTIAVAVLVFGGLGAGAALAQQGPNCQAFTTAAEVSANAGASPSVCAYNEDVNVAAKTNIRHVLLYDWTAGGHNRGHTQRQMLRLARDYGFRLDRSQLQTYITPQTLQGVDIIVFNNGDQDPLQNSTSLQAVRNFIELEGKSMLATHAALAFIPCPNEDMTNTNCRWFLRAYRTQFWQHNNHSSNATARIYVDSVQIGQIPPNAIGVDIQPATINHGKTNLETKNIFADIETIGITDPRQQLPMNGGTGPTATSRHIWDALWDEWYNYRNHPRRENNVAGTTYGIQGGPVYGPINILLSLDETSQPNSVGCNTASPCKTGDRPISWTRTVGFGLAAYNNAGHGDVFIRTRNVGGTTVNDSLMQKYNWRLMKYLARDYVGCTDPGYAEYDPQHSVEFLTLIDDQAPCKTPVSILPGSGRNGMLPGIRVEAGIVRVPTPEQGAYRVLITDLNGRTVFSQAALGGASSRAIEATGLTTGNYVLRVTTPDRGTAATRIAIH